MFSLVYAIVCNRPCAYKTFLMCGCACDIRRCPAFDAKSWWKSQNISFGRVINGIWRPLALKSPKYNMKTGTRLGTNGTDCSQIELMWCFIQFLSETFKEVGWMERTICVFSFILLLFFFFMKHIWKLWSVYSGTCNLCKSNPSVVLCLISILC